MLNFFGKIITNRQRTEKGSKTTLYDIMVGTGHDTLSKSTEYTTPSVSPKVNWMK